MRIIGILAQAIKQTLIDTFNRADQTGIGTASDGSIWSTIRGSFNISSNKASGADANYPIITQTLPFFDADIKLSDVSQGAAAALWVTDSGNWWAVGIDQGAGQSCNCQTCSGQNSATYAWNNASGGNPYTYYYTGTCTGGCESFYTYCTGYNTNGQFCTGYATECASYRTYSCTLSGTDYYAYVAPYPYLVSNGTSYTYTCNCSTCYPQYLRLIRSVSSVISEITSWLVSSTVTALSFRVKTLSNAITASVYSDTNLTNQIGSDIMYTASGASVNGKYGLTIKPSTSSQGYTVSSIEINQNKG
jgi:hypothetical protein